MWWIHSFIPQSVQGGAYKSLARPTSRCRRTESIVSLERGVCSCAELQVFSCYRSWNKEVRRRARFQQHRDASCHQDFFFLARQGAEGNSRHSAETSGEYVPSYTTVKNWVSQFKHGDFSTCDAPRPGRTKTVTITEIIDQIHELFLEDSRISTKSIAEQLGISRERVGSNIDEDLDMRKFSAKWVPKCLNADQKRQRCQSSEQRLKFFRRDPNDFLSGVIGDHGRNLVISLRPGDKVTINGVAA